MDTLLAQEDQTDLKTFLKILKEGHSEILVVCFYLLYYCFTENRGTSSPVDIRPSLLQHGLLSFQDLNRVKNMKEIHRHEERNRDVLPHGVGEIVLRIDLHILQRYETPEI